MKHILLFGAGKSSTFLIEYLTRQLPLNNWRLTVLDSDIQSAKSKIGNSQNADAVELRVENTDELNSWIQSADIVISLLPPALHYNVAIACIRFGKNLLTASYVDKKMTDLKKDIEKSGLLFLCEMGLDPGIDHMSATEIIRRLRDNNADITSFRSHCGGLVAPESDDNPWRHKVSWNPKNIVLAGKSGAVYRENNVEKFVAYEQLFDSARIVKVPNFGDYAWYPNRDSMAYIDTYKLDNVHTFIRTTLRHPEFCFGWKNLIQLKLTDETIEYDTDGMSLRNFFQLHLGKHGFSQWVEKRLTSKFMETKSLLEKLQQLMDAEQEFDEERIKTFGEFMMVDDKGKLLDVNVDDVKTSAAATVATHMREANLSIKQLFFLGLDDDKTIINQGRCSAADVLRFAVERKLALKPHDKDMVVMMHEIEYLKDNRKHSINSSLVVKGENGVRTAMAKTVGLPLAIACKLILQEKIKISGLHIPVVPEIYEPVLDELKEYGISFNLPFP